MDELRQKLIRNGRTSLSEEFVHQFLACELRIKGLVGENSSLPLPPLPINELSDWRITCYRSNLDLHLKHHAYATTYCSLPWKPGDPLKPALLRSKTSDVFKMQSWHSTPMQLNPTFNELMDVWCDRLVDFYEPLVNIACLYSELKYYEKLKIELSEQWQKVAQVCSVMLQ